MSSEKIQQLETWLKHSEDEHIEFKEANNRFDFEELVKYSVAMANERGGKVILGVNDSKPRSVVGSGAFQDIVRTKQGLIDRLRLRIEAEEIHHPKGRVIVFHVPTRPIGMPIQYKGAYWMRSGESLAPMTPDMLKRIFDESAPDFSAKICSKAVQSDLDSAAIEDFRKRWIQKSKNDRLSQLSVEQLLIDAELSVDGGLTYAALILFGTYEALGRYLPQAEVVFEYRSSDATGPAQQRLEFRKGFCLL